MIPDDLLRSEAEERVALISGLTYDVQVDLSGGPDASTFPSIVEITFSARDGAATFLNLEAAAVREIVLNDENVDTAAFADHRIQLTGLRDSNRLRVVADCRYSHTGMGLHRVVDPADGKVTPAELEAAWPYFQRRDLHKVSAVDATSFVLMSQARIRTAFAFDQHFTAAGFRLVG